MATSCSSDLAVALDWFAAHPLLGVVAASIAMFTVVGAAVALRGRGSVQ